MDASDTLAHPTRLIPLQNGHAIKFRLLSWDVTVGGNEAQSPYVDHPLKDRLVAAKLCLVYVRARCCRRWAVYVCSRKVQYRYWSSHSTSMFCFFDRCCIHGGTESGAMAAHTATTPPVGPLRMLRLQPYRQCQRHLSRVRTQGRIRCMDDKPFLEYRSSPQRIKSTGTLGGRQRSYFSRLCYFFLSSLRR